VIYRLGDEQKEVNLTTGDSAFWKIEWNDDCTYTLKLKSTSFKWNAETMKFLKDHKFFYTILKTTNEYYTYKGSVDNASNPKIIEDTTWFLEKSTPTNSELFKPLKNEVEVRKMKDSSKYAILYLYRPGKITNSLGNYGIFFDNVAMCVARNNTGYIFKILREGKFPISSRLMKDESTVNVDIRFGQIYYVKSMIHWTISSRLYNFKLEMAKMDVVKGAAEFEEIENR